MNVGTSAALLGGVISTLGGLKGHLGPQNIQFHTWRGDTTQEDTNSPDSLPRGGVGISLALQSCIKQRGAEGGTQRPLWGEGHQPGAAGVGFGWGSDAAGPAAGDAADRGALSVIISQFY